MRASRVWGVVALCVLQGSGWVLAQAWPSEIGYPFAGCIHFALIALVAVVVAIFRGGDRGGLRGAAGVALAGVCIFVLPGMAARFAMRALSDSTSTALFCSVPVMIVLIASYRGSGDGNESRIRGLLVPSLLGLGGAVILFAAENPLSVRRWFVSAVVVGCCAAVAYASVWMCRGLRGMTTAVAVAVVSLACAVVLGVYGAEVGWPTMGTRMIRMEMLRCAVFDLPVVWVTVWLMREVDPVKLSARFLLVPLLTVVEGYVAIRLVPDLRTAVAMVVVFGAGMTILLRDAPEELPGLQLR